jgi:predicted nucleic acid-binding protein
VTVIDASALVALCLREKGYERVLSELRVLPTTVELCVKEAANAIVVATQRGLINNTQATLSFKALKEASQYNLNFYPELELLDSAFDIAIASGVTIYDALYIALARRIEDKLLTRDRKQKQAADKLKIKTELF